MEKLTAKAVVNNGLKPFKDEDGYWTFTKKKGEDFRILQLTDLHYGGSIFTKKKDAFCKNLIIKIVETAKPDLIVVTGDMVFPIPVIGGTINNLKSTNEIIELFESFDIPWTVVYGNHDVEPMAMYKKSTLSKAYENAKNCLFTRGRDDLSGEGNYMIKVLNEDGSINTALMMIDSNMYVEKGIAGFYSGFDNIHDDQIDWYKQEILKISKGGSLVPSLAFFHIPPNEFKEAWKKYTRNGGDSEVKWFLGEVGETNDYFGVPKFKGNFFKEMVDFGSCKGMFMGHDHLNTVSIEYKGIRLTYGMSVDYLAYRGIMKWSSQRGGTMINIKDDSTFDVSLLPLDEVAPTLNKVQK